MQSPGGSDTSPGLETTQILKFFFLRPLFKEPSYENFLSTYYAPSHFLLTMAFLLGGEGTLHPHTALSVKS